MVFKINSFIILIELATFLKTVSQQNCLILPGIHYFGDSGSVSCFEHTVDSLKTIDIYYTNTGLSGLSFDLKNGPKISYIENLFYTNINTIDLNNSILSGFDIWTNLIGISGLKFQVYDGVKINHTLIMGSTTGCNTFVNSSFMNIKYFKIDKIGGCTNDSNSTEFPSLKFKYSFSQCSFIKTNALATTTLLDTSTSSSTTTTTILDTSTSSSTTTTTLLDTSTSSSTLATTTTLLDTSTSSSTLATTTTLLDTSTSSSTTTTTLLDTSTRNSNTIMTTITITTSFKLEVVEGCLTKSIIFSFFLNKIYF
jgi:hypothetical protein